MIVRSCHDRNCADCRHLTRSQLFVWFRHRHYCDQHLDRSDVCATEKYRWAHSGRRVPMSSIVFAPYSNATDATDAMDRLNASKMHRIVIVLRSHPLRSIPNPTLASDVSPEQASEEKNWKHHQLIEFLCVPYGYTVNMKTIFKIEQNHFLNSTQNVKSWQMFWAIFRMDTEANETLRTSLPKLCSVSHFNWIISEFFIVCQKPSDNPFWNIRFSNDHIHIFWFFHVGV